MANPFKPSFGATPPILVGRSAPLEIFREGIEDGPGAPGRTMVFTGVRGVGKTVMLTEVAHVAAQLGWVSADVTSTPGLLDQILEQTEAKIAHLAEPPGRRVTSLQLAGLGVSTQLPPETAQGWRTRMSQALDVLDQHNSGLLITVDEVHRDRMADLRLLAAGLQHFIREERQVALVVAGLPSAVSDVLNDDVLTFLRRAEKYRLLDVEPSEVAAAFRATIFENGRTISEDSLDTAARATRGYPFLIQLVGYHIWRQHPQAFEISHTDVEQGAAAARRRMGATVHEASLADLSQVDRTFLVAMASADGPIRTSEVARILNVEPSYAGVYRQRLIEAGLITAVRHGYVDFAVPYLRDYLQEHAATRGLP